MITVTFYCKNDELTGFKSEGHAGYDESGKDIVCAAVSTLVFTTIHAIKDLTEDAFSGEEDEEHAVVEFIITEEKPSEKAGVLLKAFRIGIEGVAKGNSPYLRVISKEV